MKFPEHLQSRRQKTLTFSRVMGYFRPHESYNEAKKEEHSERKNFKMKS